MSLLEIFVEVDDFWQAFEPEYHTRLIASGERMRIKSSSMTVSEIMTIVIEFHRSNYRTFKHFYQKHVQVRLRKEFPRLVSYNRFVELMKQALLPLCVFLNERFDDCSGISFIDSTKLVVCHNKRIKRHRVFAGFARTGRSTMGWFHGFKLHLVINDQGGLLGCCLTPGNIDDRKPVPKLANKLFGKLFADKGYISKRLFDLLVKRGLQLITHIKSNMKNKLMLLLDKVLLRKRSLVETVNDQLKNISQIEHSRHRSPINFMVNLVSGLIAYTYQEKKPSLNFTDAQLRLLPAIC